MVEGGHLRGWEISTERYFRLGLSEELALAFESAFSVSYGSPVARGLVSKKGALSARSNGSPTAVCGSCGGPARAESLVVHRPNQPAVFRTQTTCLGRPACAVWVTDSTEPTSAQSEEPRGDIVVNSMPKCACGCGKTVKTLGRKLATRQCIGAYNAVKREPSADSGSEFVLEDAIRLVARIPRSARLQFFQKIVDLVNSAEDVTGRSMAPSR